VLTEATDLLHEVNHTIYMTLREGSERLGRPALAQPTLCGEWNVGELVFHLLLDAQRALVALAMTTDDPATADELTYWAPYRPGLGDGPAAHAWFVQRATAAYDESGGLTALWRHTTHAAVNALRPARRRVTTQGEVLEPGDFASTLLVEATVHLLDLQGGRPGPAVPPPALAWTRRVLEGINGGPLPAEWDDTEAVLRGTGRLPGWQPLLG